MPTEEARGDASLTRGEVNRQKSSFELDLVAFFKAVQAEVMGELEDAVQEGESAEQVVERIDAIFAE